MKLEKISCNSCGAPLEVPKSANYITCNHCSTQLAIRRSQSTTFTEQLDQLTEQTQELNSRLDALSNQNELTALDRQWELDQESFMISGKHGKHLPSETGSIAGGVMTAIFGSLWTIMAIGITSSAPNVGPFAIAKVAFPLFGVAFVVFGIISSISSHDKATKYKRAKREYRERRSELEADVSRDA